MRWEGFAGNMMFHSMSMVLDLRTRQLSLLKWIAFQWPRLSSAWQDPQQRSLCVLAKGSAHQRAQYLLGMKRPCIQRGVYENFLEAVCGKLACWQELH
mmetsp:Transcript_91406/g.258177  ORF Transcript_91406/g.258177 Transcript_91406/m.258177 type:complete len:98 (+) Transcript_91406:655-948(+)